MEQNGNKGPNEWYDKWLEFQKEYYNKKKGIINPNILRCISFFIITFCTIMIVFLAIIGIWEIIQLDEIGQAIATFLVIIIGTVVFVLANEVLGDKKY